MSENIIIPIADRSDWDSGPWDSEPDYDSFRAHGFPCILRRGGAGAWCGYVGVPPGHPWHRKELDSYSCDRTGIVVEPECHGGVTYAESCQPSMGVCHVPELGESDDFWWLGFDTAHSCDLVPAVKRRIDFGFSRYRTVGYVKRETERLAEQAAEAARGGA